MSEQYSIIEMYHSFIAHSSVYGHLVFLLQSFQELKVMMNLKEQSFNTPICKAQGSLEKREQKDCKSQQQQLTRREEHSRTVPHITYSRCDISHNLSPHNIQAGKIEIGLQSQAQVRCFQQLIVSRRERTSFNISSGNQHVDLSSARPINSRMYY